MCIVHGITFLNVSHRDLSKVHFIFLSELFLFLNDIDIVNYADDNTPYCCQQDSRIVTNSLENSSFKLLTWFTNKIK